MEKASRKGAMAMQNAGTREDVADEPFKVYWQPG
jgi:hypothetical protein